MWNEKLWHSRYGHMNHGSLMTLQKMQMVDPLPLLDTPPPHTCEGCILEKMRRFLFKKDAILRAI